MIFFAFDLSEIHDRDGRLAMKYIAVAAKNLRAAKRFMKQFCPATPRRRAKSPRKPSQPMRTPFDWSTT